MYTHKVGRRAKPRITRSRKFQIRKSENHEISNLLCCKYICNHVAPRGFPARKHPGKCFPGVRWVDCLGQVIRWSDQLDRSGARWTQGRNRWMLAHKEERRTIPGISRISISPGLEIHEISNLFCLNYVCNHVAPRCSPARKRFGK